MHKSNPKCVNENVECRHFTPFSYIFTPFSYGFFRVFTAISCFSWSLPWLWQTTVIISPIRAYNSHPQCAWITKSRKNPYEKGVKKYKKEVKWRYALFTSVILWLLIGCLNSCQFRVDNVLHVYRYTSSFRSNEIVKLPLQSFLRARGDSKLCRHD